MIKLLTEEVYSLQEAADFIHTTPSLSTLRRWCRIGLRGIKLESTMLAGKRVTSEQALMRFFVALEAPKTSPPNPQDRFQRPLPVVAPGGAVAPGVNPPHVHVPKTPVRVVGTHIRIPANPNQHLPEDFHGSRK